MSRKKHNQNLNNVVSYFNSQASGYQNKSQGKLWRIFRRRELESCIKLLEPKPGEKILDAGCGAGFYSRELAKLGVKVWAIDASSEMVAQVKKIDVENVMQGDITEIQIPEIFDKILCAGVLEFNPAPGKVISNLAKHLKIGGRLVLLVPKKSFMGIGYKLFHKFHHLKIHLFTEKEINDYCHFAGLRFVEMFQPGFSMVMRYDKIK